MGIQGLTKLISEKAPGAMYEKDMKSYFGRKIAMDASMCIYQFLIAMKGALGGEGELTNAEGEVTSHLQGMWSRTIRLLTLGLKPIYVFDGAPPKLKSETLSLRKEKQQGAIQSLEDAQEDGDREDVLKFSKRTVRSTREQTEECKKLLTLMGLPVVQAKCEAEATCATMVKAGLCWAVGTEDMDALTFGAPRLLRHLNASEAKKQPVLEIHLDKVLEGLEMDSEQFIDLCILLGCDYCPKISGVGPMKAYEGIKKHRTVEQYVSTLDETKFRKPEFFPLDEVRQLFKAPEVTACEASDLVFRDPDEEGLIQFLCGEKMFSRDRVEKGIRKIQEAKAQKTQGRLDSFFAPVGVSSSSSSTLKRPSDTSSCDKHSAAAAFSKKQKVGKKAVVGPPPGKK